MKLPKPANCLIVLYLFISRGGNKVPRCADVSTDSMAAVFDLCGILCGNFSFHWLGFVSTCVSVLYTFYKFNKQSG